MRVGGAGRWRYCAAPRGPERDESGRDGLVRGTAQPERDEPERDEPTQDESGRGAAEPEHVSTGMG